MALVSFTPPARDHTPTRFHFPPSICFIHVTDFGRSRRRFPDGRQPLSTPRLPSPERPVCGFVLHQRRKRSNPSRSPRPRPETHALKCDLRGNKHGGQRAGHKRSCRCHESASRRSINAAVTAFAVALTESGARYSQAYRFPTFPHNPCSTPFTLAVMATPRQRRRDMRSIDTSE